MRLGSWPCSHHCIPTCTTATSQSSAQVVLTLARQTCPDHVPRGTPLGVSTSSMSVHNLVLATVNEKVSCILFSSSSSDQMKIFSVLLLYNFIPFSHLPINYQKPYHFNVTLVNPSCSNATSFHSLAGKLWF